AVVTLRGAVEARALVSRRIRPLRVGGRTVHQVALPFHWGTAGPSPGGSANDLVPLSGDPNVTIHEGKAMLCAVIPGRVPRGPAFRPWFARFGGGMQPTDAGHPERHGFRQTNADFGGGHTK